MKTDMKRHMTSYPALPVCFLLALALGAASCTSAPPVRIDTETNFISVETPLFPDQKGESPRFTIVLSLLDFPGDPALAKLASELFYEGKSPQAYGNDLIAAQETQYRGTYTPGDETGESMNWEYAEETDLWIIPNGSPLAVLSRSREYYTGGAHGMREKRYALIHTADASRVSLQDLLKPEAEPALRELAERELRKFAELEPGTPLGEGPFLKNTLELPDNFFITGEGLGFHWDPAEIGPYVLGPIEIIIPYRDIRGLLSPRFLPLLTKKP
jgi:hypothetical protein